MRMLSGVCFSTSLLLSAGLVTVVSAGSSQAAEPISYNRDIRPILAENCFACHGADSAARKADLRLDQRAAAVEAGAIAPNDAAASTLLERISADDAELVMPPPETKKKLTAAQKETLKRWIESGAEYQPHWSMIVPVRPAVPEPKNQAWVKNAIDAFILAGLEAKGLTPAPEADPRTLFRRIHLDVTGLPPEPEEVDAFVAEYGKEGDAALSRWIDRLMSRPAWGEHRARYWLDAARYGDTHGLHFDNYREIWPYRDWVIRAFNGNQPFDQFTVEQLAGDLLPDPSDDQLIATGFQRCNITTNEGGTIDEENLANYAVDRVQTFGWVFLGMTTNCAQCHDHKFDPITMRDYYSLAAFFRNTTQGPKDGNVKDGLGPVLVVPSEMDLPRWKALPGEIASAKEAREARKTSARPEFDAWLAAATVESVGGSVSDEGLLIHLPLNEGSGREVSNARDPARKYTAAGDVTWIPDGKAGSAPVINAARTFDLGEAGDFELNQPFSYGVWVKPVSGSASAALLARMDEQATHRGYDLWQNGNAFAVHIIDSWPGNAIKVTTKASTVKPGTWQHVFATYDGSGKPEGVRIYVDGVEQPLKVDANSIQPGASIRTATPLRIGQRSQGAVLEGAAVQDFRLYNRQLSNVEVKNLASGAELRSILDLPADKRTPAQIESLFSHWLNNLDAQYPALAKAVVDREAEYEAIRGRSPVTHIQREKMDSPAMANILARGEYDRPGEQVPAETPASLHPMPEGAPKNRLGLAQWVVDPANPLTARVTVNRFWQQIFGQGIVSTPEDVGVMGALPSNQELLDWLAVEFRENGWDVKRLFKLMLMSNAYRQSAAMTSEKRERDPDGSLLSRGPRYRMDAEMIRDYALATSGLLNAKMYGPSVKPYQPTNIWDVVGLPGGDTRNYTQSTGEDLYRRTVYSFWKRMAPPPNMEALNAPSREVCTIRRERTNTPLQALVTLNDPQFVEAARVLAQHAIATGGDEAGVIDFLGQRVLGRPFTGQETGILKSCHADFLAFYRNDPKAAEQLVATGESAVPEGTDPVQLAAWTMVCNQVLNLDEALNK